MENNKKKITNVIPYPKLSVFEFIVALIVGIGLQYLSYLIISEKLMMKLDDFDIHDFYTVTFVALCISSIVIYFITTKVLITTYAFTFLLFFLNVNFLVPLQFFRIGGYDPTWVGEIYVLLMFGTFFFPLIGLGIGIRQLEGRNKGKLYTKDYLKRGQFFMDWVEDDVVIRNTTLASWLQTAIISSWMLTFTILLVSNLSPAKGL